MYSSLLNPLGQVEFDINSMFLFVFGAFAAFSATKAISQVVLKVFDGIRVYPFC